MNLEEAVRMKRASTGKRAAIRDLLFNAIADYNKTASKAGDTIELVLDPF